MPRHLPPLILALCCSACLIPSAGKPMATRLYSDPGQQGELIVLLPGLGNRVGVFEKYGFIDADGNRPHWGRYFKEHVEGKMA